MRVCVVYVGDFLSDESREWMNQYGLKGCIKKQMKPSNGGGKIGQKKGGGRGEIDRKKRWVIT